MSIKCINSISLLLFSIYIDHFIFYRVLIVKVLDKVLVIITRAVAGVKVEEVALGQLGVRWAMERMEWEEILA